MRSERLFCEQLAYNLLWLWFLDREFDEGQLSTDSVFAKNYERVLSADVAKLFFAEVYNLSPAGRMDQRRAFHRRRHTDRSVGQSEKFCAQGRDGSAKVQSAKDDDPGNPTINFHGEKRCNATHQSTTDPDSVLFRKANGQESQVVLWDAGADGKPPWFVCGDHGA